MRTDVKLGVVFALVMVLAAGGYFMFRGEKQTPISLGDKSPATDIKTQPSKPVTPAKTAANQPKAPTTNNNRPTIAPKPRTATTSGPATTTTPLTTPAGSRPTTPPMNSDRANATDPVTPRPGSASPASVSPSPTVSDVSPPAVATNTNPASTPAVDRSAPPVTGMEVGLTGIPSGSSTVPSPESARPAMTPLSNSPSAGAPLASPTTSPVTSSSTSSALPPGIRTASSPKPEAVPARESGLALGAVERHRVQPGDSLSSLAQTYYGDSKYVRILADGNPDLTDPNRLKVGSIVNIPPLPTDADARIASGSATPESGRTGDKPAVNGKRTYTVKSGDSFYSIAKSQLGNASRWKELLALNKSAVNGDPTSLQPGQRLVLPESQ